MAVARVNVEVGDLYFVDVHWEPGFVAPLLWVGHGARVTTWTLKNDKRLMRLASYPLRPEGWREQAAAIIWSCLTPAQRAWLTRWQRGGV